MPISETPSTGAMVVESGKICAMQADFFAYFIFPWSIIAISAQSITPY